MTTMDMTAVNGAICDTRFAGRLQYFSSVGSTNSLAMGAAQTGLRCGVWVADEQTAGRGRGGHAWHSSAGEGLYLSALVTPRVRLESAMWVSLATGLAAQAAIQEAAGLSADIRWPNDLMLNGRKCGGVLVESALSAAQANISEALPYAVIGVGINVNHADLPPDLRDLATSLRIEAGREIARGALLTSVLLHLEDELGRWEVAPEANGSLIDRFTAASSWARGKRVRVGEADGYTGLTAGLTASGFLQVRSTDGTLHTVLSGGVRELI